jgi:hypothetical protein
LTASAKIFMPRSKPRRASSLKAICFAMSCAPCARISVGGGLYHSHPESANAKSRAFISEAQNEEKDQGGGG